MRPILDLVVQKVNGRWEVRFWGDESDEPPLGSYPRRETASGVAIALAVHWLRHENPNGACEVKWRSPRTGRIVEQNTYGRDPEASKG